MITTILLLSKIVHTHKSRLGFGFLRKILKDLRKKIGGKKEREKERDCPLRRIKSREMFYRPLR